MSVQKRRRKNQKRNKTNKDVFYRYLRNKSLNKTLALYKQFFVFEVVNTLVINKLLIPYMR